MKFITSCIAVMLCFQISNAQDFYRTSVIRAAPGNLLELIDILKSQATDSESTTGSRPLILRHSQGDTWDLMVVEHIGDIESHNDLEILGITFGSNIASLISKQEDLIVQGPSKEEFDERVGQNNYFHIEMFVSLAGKQEELLKEREMENIYLQELDRPTNFIFTKKFGAKWDIYTLGTYRDLPHYAESAQIPIEQEEAAAKVAGFESVGTIGSYLRALILEHNDTLANKIF